MPERTVDSLLAYELLSAFPTSILWSPTNTKGSRDHELYVGGRSAILFECKGIEDRWRIPIRARQLDDYVSGGLGQLLYLLPSKPTVAAAPWRRSCARDPDAQGYCLACTAHRGTDRRRWAGLQAHVSNAPLERRLQPWFNHWAWCVPASQLQAHLGSPTRDLRIPADDNSLAAIPGAERLCHMLPPTTVPDATEPVTGGDIVPVSGPGDPRDEHDNPIGVDDLPTDLPPGLGFSSNELVGEQILAFWEKGTAAESRHVRPGSIGLLY